MPLLCVSRQQPPCQSQLVLRVLFLCFLVVRGPFSALRLIPRRKLCIALHHFVPLLLHRFLKMMQGVGLSLPALRISKRFVEEWLLCGPVYPYPLVTLLRKYAVPPRTSYRLDSGVGYLVAILVIRPQPQHRRHLYLCSKPLTLHPCTTQEFWVVLRTLVTRCPLFLEAITMHLHLLLHLLQHW